MCATLHCSVALIITISYHMSNDSLHFSLSNNINDDCYDYPYFTEIMNFEPFFLPLFF